METFLKLMVICILIQWKILEVNTSLIRITNSNRSSNEKINEITVEILSKCYIDYKEIIIHGSADAVTIRIFQKKFAAITSNDTSIMKNDNRLRLYKNSFILTPRSKSELEKMLLSLKKLKRWSIRSPFFILDRSNGKCKNSRKMLEAAWKMNLIETFFLCTNSQALPMIYTYNPYTNRAPQRWKHIPKTTKQLNGWSLFVGSHQSENLCGNIKFDRLKHIDGAVIKVASPSRDGKRYTNRDESIIPKIFGDMAYTAKKLKYFLNATLIFNTGSTQDVFDYIKNGSCDVALLLAVSESRMSYPVLYSSFHIVTNNRGFYTPLEKIRNYYGPVTLISLCVLLPIIYIVIVLSKRRRRWSFAGFEILRLLINAALHTRIDTIALRIFFFPIFWYFLILHATFQGHITAFLMKDEYRFTAQTLEDLKTLKYDEIYIKRSIQSLITDPILKKKLILVDHDCVATIVGKENAACISEEKWFLNAAFKHKLIVSEQPALIAPNSHIYRDDWPLRDRFNEFLMWLDSSGQSTADWKRRHHGKTKETQRRMTAMAANPNVRPIAMPMLNWIYIFLLIGLIVATLSLIVEKKMRDNATMRRENRHAASQIIARRRRQLLNDMSTQRLGVGFRPQSI